MIKTKFNSGVINLVTATALIMAIMGCEVEPASLEPKVFEPENISTELVEFSPTFSSDGSEIYFARSNDEWGTKKLNSSIYYAVKKNNKWSVPKLASFSGEFNDSSPHLTHDDKTLFFISERPSAAEKISADIWKVEKDDNGEWGTPIRLEEPINSPGKESSPRADQKGNLYFASYRNGGYGQGDLYVAKNENGQYGAPENMGLFINTSKGEWNLEVNGAGDMIIFEASGRDLNLSSYGDLYISFFRQDQWTIPQNIKEINTTGSDLYPCLTNDEKTLYYTSSDSLKGTNTDIYFVNFEPLLEQYESTAILVGNQ
jgi:hypothetical protein